METILMQVITIETHAGSTFLGSGNINNDILTVALFVVMLIILLAALVVLRAVRTMVRVTMPEVLADESAAKAKQVRGDSHTPWWNRLMGLRPMAEEKDLVIDHEYDGITELDNPVPAWFNGMFYASLAFAVVYLCVYHVFGWGATQEEEYAREMAHAEQARQEWLSQAANNIDENTVTVDLRQETVAAGHAIFTQNCAACHGGMGEGGIGPNLTDDHWLHGGEVQDVFRVIKYGVLDKGMVPWEQSLTPAQIAEVSNYIVSLRGANPPNAKEPQGERVEYQESDTPDPVPSGG
ncbi:cbb3-type cytochrome c oxidase N-terminal domain-containing protein [Parapedobacter sp. 10938]|uniref:cbb3-type cytochrome c oxidase N-terminal domain-containing protein n=1 Tax=Parapedobacter flavus TaxID=3110225 RepID=UPI002DBE357A|nr:cbb3-type cytochrome c oxidase N-terminal domain-containing protein [Parapedobacter sp. 10938]MEC3881316.1 cbb3-type cytochrome c oxidase N-terminal domain-containing protein [Parapedobacter sp. 10938]